MCACCDISRPVCCTVCVEGSYTVLFLLNPLSLSSFHKRSHYLSRYSHLFLSMSLAHTLFLPLYLPSSTPTHPISTLTSPCSSSLTPLFSPTYSLSLSPYPPSSSSHSPSLSLSHSLVCLPPFTFLPSLLSSQIPKGGDINSVIAAVKVLSDPLEVSTA